MSNGLYTVFGLGIAVGLFLSWLMDAIPAFKKARAGSDTKLNDNTLEQFNHAVTASSTVQSQPQPAFQEPQVIQPQVIQPQVIQPQVIQPQVVQPQVVTQEQMHVPKLYLMVDNQLTRIVEDAQIYDLMAELGIPDNTLASDAFKMRNPVLIGETVVCLVEQ